MPKTTTDDLWENYSFVIRNDDTKQTVCVKIKDLIGAMRIMEDGNEEK